MIRNPLNRLLFTYTIFGIAMAYLETTIVVYLRLLYYPDGFEFPMRIIPADVGLIEIGRETATIVMLWFVARMAGKNFRERFALFLFSFAVWDIFYYVFLKLLLNWPGGLLTWDILFLIPAPWIAPWLAPVLVSIGFIGCAVYVLKHPEYFSEKIFSVKGWIAEIAAAGIILWSFLWETADVLAGERPDYYPWWLFFTGYAMAIGVFILQIRSGKKK